jgi:hypothetical protein
MFCLGPSFSMPQWLSHTLAVFPSSYTLKGIYLHGCSGYEPESPVHFRTWPEMPVAYSPRINTRYASSNLWDLFYVLSIILEHTSSYRALIHENNINIMVTSYGRLHSNKQSSIPHLPLLQQFSLSLLTFSLLQLSTSVFCLLLNFIFLFSLFFYVFLFY